MLSDMRIRVISVMYSAATSDACRHNTAKDKKLLLPQQEKFFYFNRGFVSNPPPVL